LREGEGGRRPAAAGLRAAGPAIWFSGFFPGFRIFIQRINVLFAAPPWRASLAIRAALDPIVSAA
jgi:hypothetical protein